MPWLLEDKLKECGADYAAGPDWAPHAGGRAGRGGVGPLVWQACRGRAHPLCCGSCSALPPALLPDLPSPPACLPLLRSATVADGKLITGQNPTSSKRVAELVAEAVAPGLREPVHGKGPGEGLHHRCVPWGRLHAVRMSHGVPGILPARPPAAHSTRPLAPCFALLCARAPARDRPPTCHLLHRPNELRGSLGVAAAAPAPRLPALVR